MEPEEGELQGLNLLALPEPCQWDSDDELLGVGGIKPKTSPIPRRRSSLSCSDDDSQPPPSSSRRVSFADAFGLSLVSVKQFDTRSLCDPTDPLEVDLKNAKEYFLKLSFALPVTLEDLLCRVQKEKVNLESLELLPETTTIKGSVRVLNMCFDKLVYIRTSLDCWSSHFDLLAEYVPESSQGITDCFSFKLTLVPPFGQQGARVDFCIRYETPYGTFWANNSGQNFVLFCHEKTKEQDENEKLVPKSCLKPGRHSSTTSATSNTEKIPEIVLNCGITAVTEPVGIKEEKTQEGQRKLKEESIRICSRRSRRKAARMAKLQRYFAQKEETDLQQTEKDTDDIDVSVPAIDEAPLNLSTQQTNAISILAEPGKNDRQESVVALDVERNQVSASQTQKQENGSSPVIQPELITSKSQTIRPALDSVNSHKSGMDCQLLENSQDKDTDTSQAVVLRYQTAGKSIGKTVEKAWECFEKCAMEKMASTTDINCSRDEANHVENTLLEDNQASQPSAPHYTFETIVAPLYHQVFERMENDRRKVRNSTCEAEESAGKRDDGRLRVVTYTDLDPRSNPEISAKHGNDDNCHETSKETFQQYLHHEKSDTENTLSVMNVQTEGDEDEDEDSPDDSLSDITNYFLDTNILESNAAPVVIDSEKQHSSDRQTLFLGEVSTIDPTGKTPEIIPSQTNRSNVAADSLHTLQQEQTSTDSSILPVQSELDLKSARPFTATVSEDKSVIQKTFKTQISTEINKTQDKEAQTSEQSLNIQVKCPDESNTPLPDATALHSKILSNVIPKINQSGDVSPSQDLTQATIQPLIPDSGATASYHQENLIQETSNTCQNGESSHQVGSEKKSTSNDTNEDVNIWENIENDNEIIQKEIVKFSPEQTDVDVCQINNNEENHIFLSNIPDTVTGFCKTLVQNTTGSNICSNPDHPYDHRALQETRKEDVEVNNQVTDPAKIEEQESTSCLRENPSKEAEEIKEVEKQLVEKDQENNEKIKEESYITADNVEKLQKDAEGKDAAPEGNVVDWKDKKHLEADLQEQMTADGFSSVATLQNISNEDSFIKEVHQHIEEEQQNICLEQTSEEPKSTGQIVCEAEEIVCETGSPQQDNNEDALQENGEKDVEENIQVKDSGKNKEQEQTICLRENQSVEVETQLEEKEEKEQENRVEQENEEKIKEGSKVTADNEEKLQKDAEGKDAAPKENVVDWKNKKDLKADLQGQVTVDGFSSVTTLQNISNEDSFIEEVHQHIEEEQQNICSEQRSKKPGSKGQTDSEVEETVCKTGSSQTSVDVNTDVDFKPCAKYGEMDLKLVNKEKNLGVQVDELDKLLEKQESLNQQSENLDDSTSTESLTDDEMEVYLLGLKMTQQTGLKDVLFMEKRHSISRSWTISPMPSISEHTDEDQPTALLDDLLPEQTLELEKDPVALSNEEEENIEPNLLWWREFFSSENMAKVMVYTLLFVVFLITLYICDFIACFGLYLIALYWLYFQVQREPLKLKRHLT